MVRPCSSHCSSIGRLRGRSLQSLFASPKLFLPSVIHSFPHRNSTKSFHSHSLPNQSASGGAYYYSGARHLTPSDAQRRTIYALSTPPGKGGIAVVRVSGPDACKVWKAVTRPVRGSTIDKLPTPRLAELRHIIDPLTGEKLDDGLVIFFKGPKSFTTEDVVELQVHSGRAVLSSILRALSRLPYCRPAQPGEFTRRAFQGGRLDLTQVEGLRDLIDAETEAQRRVAVSNVAGAQRVRFDALRAQILDCLMYVEGFIDFGEDVDELGQDRMLEQACAHAQGIIDCIRSHLSDNRRGEILRSGIRLVIFGPPNAGKSSLFNFLAERDAAIISPIPGTTRDILSLTLDIGGLPVVLNDTAGIRSTTNDAIERIGVERAGNVIQTADVSICVLSLDEIIPSTAEREVKIAIPDDVIRHLKPDTVFLLNKSDLARPPTHDLRKALNDALLQHASGTSRHCWSISLRSGEGTQEFLDGLGSVLKERYAYTETMSLDGSPLVTQARHRDYLESAVRHLEEFKSYPLSQIDIAAESLRYAARAIGAVSGSEVSTEEVLGAIFSSFCVGK
ncbi:tRNA modification GTPase TrmE [Boletus edulis BED1]|uniref:tRNA modification GTPase TrmE n=1 Tax=Boletus edulis BED1 TaxID=1328754 RepID=A0AAD4C8K1_BOLED|nr:tRNA modification GTPase TrmE [Boletus edulis BED1]